jgi:hypothetical protein
MTAAPMTRTTVRARHLRPGDVIPALDVTVEHADVTTRTVLVWPLGGPHAVVWDPDEPVLIDRPEWTIADCLECGCTRSLDRDGVCDTCIADTLRRA